MENSRIQIYISILFSAIPSLIEHLIGIPKVDFAAFDSLTLFFTLLTFYTVMLLVSRWAMLISGIILSLFSVIFSLANIEYYNMYGVFISYDVLPLVNDMLTAIKNFDLTPVIYMSIISLFIMMAVFHFAKANIHKTSLHYALPIITLSLVSGMFTNSIHAKRYDLQPQDEVNGHKKLNYSFENPIMMLTRSLPAVKHAFDLKETTGETEYFEALAASLRNKIAVDLPEKYHRTNFKSLLPEYPGYTSSKNPQQALRFIPDNTPNNTASSSRPNIILLVMESVRAYETGIVDSNRSITPNLDKIANQSLLYSNFFATNRMTVKSELSILCSALGTQNGAPFSVLKGELSGDCLPTILSRNGYNSLWFHGYTREFFNRSQFHSSLGFSKIYSKENFVADGYKEENDIGWGVPDTELYKTVLNKLGQQKEPFFAEVLTLTNHQPFDWDYKDFSFPDNIAYSGDDRYRNYRKGIYYSDYALGQFWKSFNQSALKDNTIVIITGDHGVPFYPENLKSESEQYKALFHMPLIISGPNITQGEVSTQLSHLDIAPTVLSLLNINEPVTFLGRPFLGKYATSADRPIYLLNMDDFGFLYGGLACIPREDFCNIATNSCIKYEDKYCKFSDTKEQRYIPQINPLKNYLALFLEAGLPN